MARSILELSCARRRVSLRSNGEFILCAQEKKYPIWGLQDGFLHPHCDKKIVSPLKGLVFQL